jgi:hypothetical protein
MGVKVVESKDTSGAADWARAGCVAAETARQELARTPKSRRFMFCFPNVFSVFLLRYREPL